MSAMRLAVLVAFALVGAAAIGLVIGLSVAIARAKPDTTAGPDFMAKCAVVGFTKEQCEFFRFGSGTR